jgi:hypothetical protein
MRVALFSWESLHSINIGGLGVHVTELAAGLERRGHMKFTFSHAENRIRTITIESMGSITIGLIMASVTILFSVWIGCVRLWLIVFMK